MSNVWENRAHWLPSLVLKLRVIKVPYSDCFKVTVVNYSTQGAFVVDRLSILHISAVQRFTGATILSTFSMEISEESFGQLERIDHVVLNEKR